MSVLKSNLSTDSAEPYAANPLYFLFFPDSYENVVYHIHHLIFFHPRPG